MTSRVQFNFPVPPKPDQPAAVRPAVRQPAPRQARGVEWKPGRKAEIPPPPQAAYWS